MHHSLIDYPRKKVTFQKLRTKPPGQSDGAGDSQRRASADGHIDTGEVSGAHG
jgi:hypothetical protein